MMSTRKYFFGVGFALKKRWLDFLILFILMFRYKKFLDIKVAVVAAVHSGASSLLADTDKLIFGHFVLANYNRLCLLHTPLDKFISIECVLSVLLSVLVSTPRL